MRIHFLFKLIFADFRLIRQKAKPLKKYKLCSQYIANKIHLA